ncbi:MAG: MFS transporter [Acidobacteriia bacterium]|nr:MFS transporter [Terriglobia bacterium]
MNPVNSLSLRKSSSIERNVIILSVAVFLVAFGEELWNSFLPKYLEALGGSIALIAVFGTFKDFLDAVYQYPGGVLSDRLGERQALTLFAGMAACGYVIYLLSSRPWMLFIGVLFVMSWSSLGSPAIFAAIGASLSSERRTLGFSWQSLLKRLPIVIAPVLGGLLIAREGMVRGVRTGLAVAVLMALFAMILQQRFYLQTPSSLSRPAGGMVLLFRSFSPVLKQLLFSDILARLAEGIAEIFIVIYAINIIGLNPKQFGLLVGVQMTTAIAGYLPAAALASRVGRKPLVFFTFICFALFPLMVAHARSFPQMFGAFVVGGLREFGEPARKAMIVNFADEQCRGRHVGLYYFIRNISVTPAAAVGGWLWHILSPNATFHAAFLCGVAGALFFLVSVHDKTQEVNA